MDYAIREVDTMMVKEKYIYFTIYMASFLSYNWDVPFARKIFYVGLTILLIITIIMLIKKKGG